MSDTNALLARARAYGAARGIKLTTVSKLLFGDWRRLDALASGAAFLRPPTLTAALKRMDALEAKLADEPTRAHTRAPAEAARDA